MNKQVDEIQCAWTKAKTKLAFLAAVSDRSQLHFQGQTPQEAFENREVHWGRNFILTDIYDSMNAVIENDSADLKEVS